MPSILGLGLLEADEVLGELQVVEERGELCTNCALFANRIADSVTARLMKRSADISCLSTTQSSGRSVACPMRLIEAMMDSSLCFAILQKDNTESSG
mmetsp:Transcript_70346/g.187449  ORF Transcript_70346/g.187449 Transcript_70346/m.187449 type:complete len:97 (+) Transcript_70346:307-597(+)